MKKPETKFRERVMPLFWEIPRSYWMSIQQTSLHGDPDVIGCVGGQFVGLEFKKSKKDAEALHGRTALQRYKINQIKQSGGLAYFVHPLNYKEVLEDIWKCCT